MARISSNHFSEQFIMLLGEFVKGVSGVLDDLWDRKTLPDEFHRPLDLKISCRLLIK